MRKTGNIMRKELLRWSEMSKFYILFSLALLGVGVYTWFFNDEIPFFYVDDIVPSSLRAIYWCIAIFVPMLATGTIIQERKYNTIPLLLSKPVCLGHFVLGKLMAITLIIFSFLLLTLTSYITICDVTKFSLYYLLPIYVFLLLMGVAYAAISMAVATFFKMYWKSYFWSYLIVLALHIVLYILAQLSAGEIALFFQILSLRMHFEYVIEGGFALSSLLYLASFAFIGIYLTIYKLSKDYL